MKTFWKNATGLTKGVIIAIVLAGLWFGIQYLSKSGKVKTKEEAIASKINVNEDADLVLAYNTFPGVGGILLMNEGMEPSENSRLFKEYGIKLQIKQMDIVSDTRDGLKTGVLDLAYCTVDALPIEMSSGSGLLNEKTRVIMKVNESRGADAIVVTKGINKVADLKGKKIAYAIGTASNTLLINVLESSGLTAEDITAYKVSDGVEAANAFKNGQCDAAVVWAPDDEDCVQAIKGSKILISTATATQIIADGLLVNEKTLNEKRDLIVKLCKAWVAGNAELNDNSSAKKTANSLFAKGFNFPEEVAAASADKIRFSTLGDNKKFFGLDAVFTGVTGEKMYGTMSVKYSDLGLANSPASWRQVSDASIVEELLKDPNLAAAKDQAADEPVKFKPVTEADKTAEAQSSKTITLEFATADYTLDDFNKSIIDREVSGLAQRFANARIRVEGNTDNTGNPKANKALSLKRAQAVVDYLIREYKFDKNKFIVIGNGQDKPLNENDTPEGRQSNRRTDFQFIW